MDFCYFIGIDIAKDTAPADRLDWAVYTQQGVQLSTHTANTLAGIKAVLVEFKALPDWNPKQVVFCMEHTGIYNAHLLELLHHQKLAIWLDRAAGAVLFTDQTGRRNAARQNRSGGPAIRLMPSGLPNTPMAPATRRFRDQMRLWEPPREVIQQLAFLSATRQRLNQAARAAPL